MNLDWLEELEKKEPDAELKRLNELEEEYKKTFGYNTDYTTALCDDYEELFKQLEKCIKLKVPYHILYKDNDDYNEVDL